MGDKLTEAQVRALKLMAGRSVWPVHGCGIRTDVRSALIRKGMWEEYRTHPYWLAQIRLTPAGIAALAAIKDAIHE